MRIRCCCLSNTPTDVLEAQPGNRGHELIDPERASRLAQQALELWGKGEARLAVPLYEEAIALADPVRLGSYQGQLGGALMNLGELEKACEQYKLALATRQAQQLHRGAADMSVERYFLAQNYLARGMPGLALETIDAAEVEEPGERLPFFMFSCRAFALQALGRRDEACTAVRTALSMAPTEEKRESLAKMFEEHNVGQ